MLLFIDGYDHYTVTGDKYDLTPGSSLKPYIDTTEGRFVNGSLQIQDNKINEVVKYIDTSNELIVGVAFKFDGGNTWIIRLRDEVGVTVCSHETEGTGGKVWRGVQDSGTLLGDYTNAFTTDTWQYLEFRVKRDATEGEVEVRVNGTPVLALTNQNTGAVDFDEVFLRSTFQTGGNCWLDDLYILNTTGAKNNTFLGDVRVTALLPKAQGSINDFSASDLVSPTYQMVDEQLHDADVTYAEAGQLGAQENYDQFNFADLGLSPGTIFGVQTVNAAKKTDAGQLRYIDQLAMAGVPYDRPDEITANAVDYKMSTWINETDPRDGQDWTEDKITDAGSGYKITFREI